MIYGYRAVFNSICTKDYHDGQEYGEWSTYYDNSLESVTPLGQKESHGYRELESTLDLDSGEEAFVVWVECNTGDSFGSGEANEVQAMGIFKTRQPAEELQKAIIDSANGRDEHNFSCTTSDGQEFKESYAPWQGYFDSLHAVHIERVILGRK